MIGISHDVQIVLPGKDVPARPFRRAEALRAGFTPADLATLVQAGAVRRPFRGVLIPAGLPDDLETRAAAVRLVLPEGAALCRTTAAWLHGIDVRLPGAHRALPVVECAVPRRVSPLRRAGIACFQTDIEPGDVVEVAGLPCLSPARTAIDLARWSVPGMGLAALDAMARAGLVAPEELAVLVERWRGDRFVEQARRLVGLCDARAESAGESWMRLRFVEAGFPVPELQISLCDDVGREVRRLDAGYRRKRKAWEYDGEQFHDGVEARLADEARRREIERRWGWTVLVVRKGDVLGRSMRLEQSIGEVLGMEPLIRRRAW